VRLDLARRRCISSFLNTQTYICRIEKNRGFLQATGALVVSLVGTSTSKISMATVTRKLLGKLLQTTFTLVMPQKIFPRVLRIQKYLSNYATLLTGLYQSTNLGDERVKNRVIIFLRQYPKRNKECQMVQPLTCTT
jgi:hypothetical protein